MAHSRNPSVWVERRRTKAGYHKYRVRAEVDGRRLPAGSWTPKRTYADEEASKLEARLWAGDREVVQRRRQMTWDGFSHDYLKHSEDTKGRRTFAQFDRPAVNSFGDWLKAKHGPGFPLASITSQHGSEWLIDLRRQGYNDTSRKMLYGSMATALNHAVKTKLLTESPFKALTRPHSEESGRALADTEIARLFALGTHDLWSAGTFSLNCGPRISEVTGKRGLGWEHVEVLAHRGQPAITMAKALEQLTMAKVMAARWFGRLPARLRKTARKVKKDCRFPINAAAKDAMGPPRATGKVFKFQPNKIQHDLAKARRLAGLPEDITFHCFRHTFATRYLARGGHIEDLLETKLWSDYNALLRYVHVEDEVLERRFDANAAQFPPPSPQKHSGPAPSV